MPLIDLSRQTTNTGDFTLGSVGSNFLKWEHAKVLSSGSISSIDQDGSDALFDIDAGTPPDIHGLAEGDLVLLTDSDGLPINQAPAYFKVASLTDLGVDQFKLYPVVDETAASMTWSSTPVSYTEASTWTPTGGSLDWTGHSASAAQLSLHADNSTSAKVSMNPNTGDVYIAGDLSVQGSTIEFDVANIDFQDSEIGIGFETISGVSTPIIASGTGFGGIEIGISGHTSFPKFLWDEGDQAWEASNEGSPAKITGSNISAMQTKLDGIEDSANNFILTTSGVNSLNVNAATVNSLTVETAVPPGALFTDTTYTVGASGLTQENFTTTLKTKLSGIETSADVTDTANVSAAGAVMASGVTTASMAFVLDEDSMASDSSTKLATQQSIKAYVDSTATAASLEFTDDTTTTGLSIDLDTETLAILGSNDILTTGSGNNVTISANGTLARIDSPTFTGTPEAPTVSGGNSSTQIATTAFVQGEISGNTDDVTLTGSGSYLGISGQQITVDPIDISDDTNLTAVSGITLTGDTLSLTDETYTTDEQTKVGHITVTSGANLGTMQEDISNLKESGGAWIDNLKQLKNEFASTATGHNKWYFKDVKPHSGFLSTGTPSNADKDKFQVSVNGSLLEPDAYEINWTDAALGATDIGISNAGWAYITPNISNLGWRFAPKDEIVIAGPFENNTI